MLLSKSDREVLQMAINLCVDAVTAQFDPLVERLPGLPPPPRYADPTALDVTAGALRVAIEQETARMVIPMLVQFRDDTLALRGEVERLLLLRAEGVEIAPITKLEQPLSNPDEAGWEKT